MTPAGHHHHGSRELDDLSVFDEKAATWDDEGKIERARAVAAAIRRTVPLTSTTRVLEYGAGTGLVSQELARDAGPLTLADPSKGMRDVMRAKVAKGALPTATRIWDLDLTSGTVPGERFDLIVTVMTLHHIPDLTPVLDGFAKLLDDGGRLCVADLVKEDGSFHRGFAGGTHFHGHHGFDIGELSAKLAAAGFGDIRSEQVYEIVKEGVPFPVFLATATKTPR